MQFISFVFPQISYVPWPILVLLSRTFQSHNIAFLLCPLLDNLHPNHHHHRKLDLYQVHWLTFLTFLCLFHHFSPYLKGHQSLIFQLHFVIFFNNFHALSFHFKYFFFWCLISIRSISKLH